MTFEMEIPSSLLTRTFIKVFVSRCPFMMASTFPSRARAQALRAHSEGSVMSMISAPERSAPSFFKMASMPLFHR